MLLRGHTESVSNNVNDTIVPLYTERATRRSTRRQRNSNPTRHRMTHRKWTGPNRRSSSRVKSVTADSEGTLARALSGNRNAIRELVDQLTPVIHARVTRKLMSTGQFRDVRQDTKDFAQEIFLTLFQNNAKLLETWNAERGMSLENFVGLIAERHVISALRSGKRNPWREREPLEVSPEPISLTTEVEAQVIQSNALDVLLDRLRMALSPQGWHLFELLYIKDCTVAEVQAQTSLTSDAIYAWRSRLRKQARQCQEILQQEEAQTHAASSRASQ